MNAAELKAWIGGFAAALQGTAPDEKEWAALLEKVAELEASAPVVPVVTIPQITTLPCPVVQPWVVRSEPYITWTTGTDLSTDVTAADNFSGVIS